VLTRVYCHLRPGFPVEPFRSGSHFIHAHPSDAHLLRHPLQHHTPATANCKPTLREARSSPPPPPEVTQAGLQNLLQTGSLARDQVEPQRRNKSFSTTASRKTRETKRLLNTKLWTSQNARNRELQQVAYCPRQVLPSVGSHLLESRSHQTVSLIFNGISQFRSKSDNNTGHFPRTPTRTSRREHKSQRKCNAHCRSRALPVLAYVPERMERGKVRLGTSWGRKSSEGPNAPGYVRLSHPLKGSSRGPCSMSSSQKLN
jgi:hypothetical protein